MCLVRPENMQKKNIIFIVAIPPQTSHRTEPLERAIFEPMKTYMNFACDTIMVLIQSRKSHINIVYCYLFLFIPLAVFIFYPFSFFILILSTRFPCSLYQRGWDCTAWWVSPYVGVSLCVDVRLCRVSSCTWPVGDALVSRGLASGV